MVCHNALQYDFLYCTVILCAIQLSSEILHVHLSNKVDYNSVLMKCTFHYDKVKCKFLDMCEFCNERITLDDKIKI